MSFPIHEVWLTGPICCGKDFVAQVLVQEQGFWSRGVGELIATEIELDRGLPPGYIYSEPGAKDRFRSVLQAYGNRGRAQDPDYWLKAWLAARGLVPDRRAVMPSCRFVREAQLALRLGTPQRPVVIVRVACPKTERQERIRRCYPSHTAAQEADAAEGEIARVPYHFELPGTLPAAAIVPALVDLFRIWQQAGCPVLGREV